MVYLIDFIEGFKPKGFLSLTGQYGSTNRTRQVVWYLICG